MLNQTPPALNLSADHHDGAIATMAEARTSLQLAHAAAARSTALVRHVDVTRDPLSALSDAGLAFPVAFEAIHGGESGVAYPRRGVYRPDTGAPLGVVGGAYTLLTGAQIGQAFSDLLEPLRRAGGAKLVRATAFDGGARCSAEFSLPGELSALLYQGSGLLSERGYEARLRSTWGHDGQTKVRTSVSLYCRKCTNGMHGWADIGSMSAIHRSGILSWSKDVAAWYRSVGHGLKATGETMATFATRRVDPPTVRALVGEILEAEIPADESKIRKGSRAEAILEMVYAADGTFVPAGATTMLSILEAVTAFDTHRAPVRVMLPASASEAERVAAASERRYERAAVEVDGLAGRAWDVLRRAA
jgi:hypothetical protein